MAGASMPVDEQLYTLEAAETARLEGDSDILAWDGAESFSDWIEKVEAKALEHLPLLDEHGELVEKGIHAFHEYQDLLQAGGMASLAVANLSRTQAYGLLFKVTSRWGDLGVDALRARGMVNQAEWLRKGIAYVDEFYLAGKRTLTAPGTALPWMKAQAVKYILRSQTFEEALTAARGATNGTGRASFGARILNVPFIRDNMDKLVDLAKSPQVGRLANITGNVFGRPWTTTVINSAGEAETLVVGRNATNLLRVARGAQGLSRATDVLKVAGGLRVLGVAGSAFATVDSAMSGWGTSGTRSAGPGPRAGRRARPRSSGTSPRSGFNGSLTAAMIAPNPVTWGAVAVTGVIYGGARLVEHWDDVTKAVGDATTWVGDTVDKGVDAVKNTIGDGVDEIKDTLGDGIEAVKESPVNPANWF